MKKYKLEIIVFITGACVMILELVGSRVLAPYVGNSLFVWTSLIGIILGSLSLGYWYGGKLADRNASEKIFAVIILASAACVGVIAMTKPLILGAIARNITDIRVSSTLAATILFAPSSILLGMISPYAVKLKMRALSSSGATVGSLYAISTVGSIAGTFLSGFWLISAFGNTAILWIIAAALSAAAMLAHAGSWQKTKLAAFILCVAIGAGTLRAQTAMGDVIDIDTPYQRVIIFNGTDHDTGRPIRAIVTGPRIIQSAIFTDNEKFDLVFPYNKYYRLDNHFFGKITNSALMIGGAGYTAPRDWLNRHPDGRIDVVEIDPGMTKIAVKYFGLKANPRMRVYHEDARTYLARTDNTYDAIFGDAFQSLYGLPYQLTTVEAVRDMRKRLNDNGVVIVNIISAMDRSKNKFLRAELATFKTVFPYVELFATHPEFPPNKIQNIMLVARKSASPAVFNSSNAELNEYLKNRVTDSITDDMPILTDDHAPVDQYLLKLGL